MEIKNDLIRKCRHKAEIPFTIFAVALNVFCGWVLIRLLRIAGNNEWATKLLVDVLKCEEADVVIAIRFGRFIVVALIILILVMVIWELFKNIGIAIANDIPIDEDTASNLYKEYTQFCEKLGIEKVPKLFVALNMENMESTGIKIKGSNYVRIDYSLVENAIYGDDWTAVRFEAAWELAHIALGHNNYGLIIATISARYIPIVKSIYSRILCYSADKLASEILSIELSIEALLLNQYLDMYEADKRELLLSKMEQEMTPIERFSVLLNDLTTDTPSYNARLLALLKGEDGKIL